MVLAIQSETQDEKIARLEAEVAAERARADAAEAQLQQVQIAVRAYKQKQELVARARKAREARARAVKAQSGSAEVQASPAPAHVAEPAGQPPRSEMVSSGVEEAWEDPDPTLDDRLTKYLESTFEPDRSRDWMLKG